MRKKYLVYGLLFLLLSACVTTNNVYYPKNIAPYTGMKYEKAQQAFTGYPPLLMPQRKRRTIVANSQNFRLAILNAVDMSGRALDLQRSLADILYTELFKMGRFDLLDRDELVDLDPEWLISSLRSSVIAPDYTDVEEGNAVSRSRKSVAVQQTMEYMKDKKIRMEEMQKHLQQADGLLLVYITSRQGGAEGGYFTIDYRIVNNNRKIVLLADTMRINYETSTSQEVEYSRDDVRKITENILKTFPQAQETMGFRVVSRDARNIIIDVGKNKNLIPGLAGYVVQRNYSQGNTIADHCIYLGEFIITQVFQNSSNAVLIDRYRTEPEWDVEMGDEIIIK